MKPTFNRDRAARDAEASTSDLRIGVILVHDPTPEFAQPARLWLVFDVEPPGGFLDAQNVMVRLQMLRRDQHHAGALQNADRDSALQRSQQIIVKFFAGVGFVFAHALRIRGGHEKNGNT